MTDSDWCSLCTALMICASDLASPNQFASVDVRREIGTLGRRDDRGLDGRHMGHASGMLAVVSNNQVGGVVLAVFTLPFLAVFAAMIVIHVRNQRRREAERSRRQAVPGRVIESRVTSHSMYSNDVHGHITMYTPEVSYEYIVGAQTLRGDQINDSPIGGWSAAGSAEEVVARYPPGRQMPVYVDSADSSRAVLEPTDFNGAVNGVGMVALVIAEVVLLVLLVLGIARAVG